MHTLDNLRASSDEELVHGLYESVEKIKSTLESDTYCEIMNALLVVRERLHASSDEEESPRQLAVPPPALRDVLRVGMREIRSESEREHCLLRVLRAKHEIERDVIELRRAYREGREALAQSLKHVLKLIQTIERQPLIDETPIVL